MYSRSRVQNSPKDQDVISRVIVLDMLPETFGYTFEVTIRKLQSIMAIIPQRLLDYEICSRPAKMSSQAGPTDKIVRPAQ
jgi:hypothetical protein